MNHDAVITAITDGLRVKHPEYMSLLGGRVHRAEDIAQLQLSPGRRETIFHVEENIYNVMSQEHHDQYHRVDVETRTCTCPDAARGAPCKHRLAVYIYKRILDASKIEQTAIVQAHTERASNEFIRWKKVNPDANINFGDWRSHPHQGTVDYVDPCTKETHKLEVLASDKKTKPGGEEYVELVSINGDHPFTQIHHSNSMEATPTQFNWGDFNRLHGDRDD